MKVFRQFDYFRKSTSPEQIKPTCIGGLISLLCVAVSYSKVDIDNVLTVFYLFYRP